MKVGILEQGLRVFQQRYFCKKVKKLRKFIYLKRRENQEGYAGVLYMMGGMWTLDLI